MLTEEKAIKKLKSGEFEFPPTTVRVKEIVKDSEGKRDIINQFLNDEVDADTLLDVDFILELEWENKKKRFLVEYKSVGTPKKLAQGIAQLKDYSKKASGANFLLMAPYFSEEDLERARREGINVIDMSGNGMINLPEELFIYRTGNKNKYPSSSPIKNIYRGVSSLVGRVFFVQQKFKKVKNVKEKIEESGGEISLSTVSKVLNRLEEDLIITKSDVIKLIRPDMLLDKLVDNYTPPKITRRVKGKLKDETNLGRITRFFLIPEDIKSAFLAESDKLERAYVEEVDPVLEESFFEKTDQFPDLELLETDDQRVFFGCTLESSIQSFRCSAVQTYLDLMTGGKREKEAAEKIRKKDILDPIKSNEA